MTTICLDKETNYTIKLYLYTNVVNLPEVRKKCLSKWENGCLINPSLILSPFHVTLAANRAAKHKTDDNLVAKSISGELLFNLSHTKNINKALQTFGSTDENTACLLAVFHLNGKEESLPNIEGNFVELEELENLTDLALIKEVYEITEEDLQITTIEDIVYSRIAVKDLDITR